jgi:arabinofuranosyltransferase
VSNDTHSEERMTNAGVPELSRLEAHLAWMRGVAVRWGSVVVVGLGVAALVAQSLYLQWTLDDAYIAFAYAQNWVQGNGLVFNAGERVEGYTCFLWVVLAALGLALGANIVWWSTALGISSGIAAVLAAWQLARELSPPSFRGAAASTAVIVGAYPALACWAGSGMETALFTALVTTAIWRHVRDGARSVTAPICLALASMTRPEGWLLSALLCLDAVRTGSWRDTARYIGVFLAAFGPYYAWRFWYYGYPVPNTFYAKVGQSGEQVLRGWRYVREFLWLGQGMLLLTGATAGVLAMPRRLLAVAAFIVAYIAYVIVVGGDVFFSFRFLVPLVPVLAALSVAGLLAWTDRLMPDRRPAAFVASASCVVLLVVSYVPFQQAQTIKVRAARNMGSLTGYMCEQLKVRTRPDDAIATGGIGQLKFCTGRPVIDVLGLTDKHIAHRQIERMGQGLAGHEKYDSEYVLARWPKFMVIPRGDGRAGHPVEGVRDMWQQPVFKSYYVPDPLGYRRRDAE